MSRTLLLVAELSPEAQVTARKVAEVQTRLRAVLDEIKPDLEIGCAALMGLVVGTLVESGAQDMAPELHFLSYAFQMQRAHFAQHVLSQKPAGGADA